MFNKLFAICLLVEDFDISFGFYSIKLGLPVNSRDSHFADFKLEGTSLAIFGKDEATSMFPKEYMQSGGGCVIAYQVDDLDRAVKELNSSGIKIFEGPKQTTWGQKVAYFNDPDGNILEVSEK